jgi:chemosensory pili system protein ChpA (sensor histidine kinase/response regulator)
MDVEMPRMDGFELTATLRADGAFEKVPIVMLTSRGGDKHRAKAFGVGVTKYLVKPYQEEQLVETILRLVG